jgi:TrkA-N domain
MKSRILIAGGYGVIGTNIARNIRKVYKDVELILAGRNPENGKSLAQELGGARTIYLDLTNPQSLEAIRFDQFDLIVAALKDPFDILSRAAIEHNIAHIGLSEMADEIVPILFKGLQSSLKRPIVLLAHQDAGVITLIAKKAADKFSQINSIEIAGVYDDLDLLGPMNQSDFEDSSGMTERTLLLENGKWIWVDPAMYVRKVQITKDLVLNGFPVSLLDVPSLAAITSAASIRWDYVQGDSIGTIAGDNPSHDTYIDIEGTLQNGDTDKHRIVVSDPKGQAHLVGIGVLVAIERIFGLDGQEPTAGGLHLPETLVNPDTAISRLEQFGVKISTNSIN